MTGHDTGSAIEHLYKCFWGKCFGALMKRVEELPFKTQTVLTDNGKSLSDRFTRAAEHKPSGRHLFG
ncbi:hypothetical protein GCM10022228_11300 [Halomonas cibimaris]|uniref:Integrase catalytic domain-containing protein n=1 Tax=Halomonas cibimaris TaxID=657012 RepID=A0ABP7LKV0_9GAMM